MHSNITVLPSTNLAQILGFMDMSLSDLRPSYGSLPQLKAPPSKSLIEIPPLLTQSPLEKRLNFADMGNTIQKKIKYNPEVPVQATQIPSLSSHLIFDNRYLKEKTLLEDLDDLINNHPHSNKARNLEKPDGNYKMNQFESYKYEENQLQSMNKLATRSMFFEQKDEVRSCDLSELIIPPLSSSMSSRKPVEKKDDMSYQLQQALQDLQQKLAGTQYQGVQAKPANVYSSSLLFESSNGLFEAKLPSYGQSNINNLAKRQVSEFKNDKITWNESPKSIGAETNGSCSTLDLCESDFAVSSQGEIKCEEDSNSSFAMGSIKSQRKQIVKKQETLAEKVTKEKAKTKTQIVDVKIEEKKVKIEEETIKDESTEKKSRKPKLNPLFVSKWDVGSERRRNRWQITQGSGPQKPEGSKKQQNMAGKIVMCEDEDDEDLAETMVGEEYQAEITMLCKRNPKIQGKRCPKLKWNPLTVKSNKLEAYFKKIETILACPLNQEKAINLLVNNQNDPKKVYSHIEGREREYIREFKIRPKRIPDVPLFGDYRVLY